MNKIINTMLVIKHKKTGKDYKSKNFNSNNRELNSYQKSTQGESK